MGYRLSGPALRQIDEILVYSHRHYGTAAARRYKLLLEIALEEVGAAPQLSASRRVPGTDATREYDIRHARAGLPRGTRLGNPRHKIVYRVAEDGIVEILAIVGHSLPSALGPER